MKRTAEPINNCYEIVDDIKSLRERISWRDKLKKAKGYPLIRRHATCVET
jgi:hypothetical protein